MRFKSLVLMLLALGVVACSDSSGPSASYNSLAGSYEGGMLGTSQGVVLAADLSITITQGTAGQLTGSFAINGVLTDGQSSLPVNGTGSITGTIASGNNPSVNITIRPGTCQNRTSAFSGSFDTANQRLTITGNVQILNQDCTVALTYPTTFLLTK